MTTSEQVMKEIERQVSLAKQAAGGQAQREALYAVRALCNVMLQDEQYTAPGQMSAAAVRPAAAVLEEKPLQEEDANGESLFDF